MTFQGQDARDRNPRRWSRQTCNWTPVTVVTLNPERDTLVQAATPQIQFSGSIGTPAFPSQPGNVAPRRATQGTGGAEPHPEPRAASRGWQHRAIPAVSTVASLASVGGSHSGETEPA
jgi:hypothetical protein